jgi:hypothetical protein
MKEAPESTIGRKPGTAAAGPARPHDDRAAAQSIISSSRLRREEGEETELGGDIRERDGDASSVYAGSTRKVPRGSDVE